MTKPGTRKAPCSTSGERKVREEAVLYHFRSVVGAMRDHFRTVELETGISGSQLWALAEIRNEPGIKAGGLAEAMSIHASTASNLIDKLEKKNLVCRERKDTDSRTVRLNLTEAGMQVVSKGPQPHEGLVRYALRHLPEDALAQLYNGLEQLAKEMQAKEAIELTPLADL